MTNSDEVQTGESKVRHAPDPNRTFGKTFPIGGALTEYSGHLQTRQIDRKKARRHSTIGHSHQASHSTHRHVSGAVIPLLGRDGTGTPERCGSQFPRLRRTQTRLERARFRRAFCGPERVPHVEVRFT